MRPIPSPASKEAYEMLEKAQSLLEKVESLEKAEKCPECGSKVEKGACMKMGCGGMKSYGSMKKGEQHRIQTFGTTPDASTFHIETGGNTYHQQYSTNNTLLESEDVANKGATSQSYNLEALGAKTNTHDRAVETHEIDTGMTGRTSV
tara:strand:- start:497 stop:940 length:444 start_codon:yes stop_codon:yes gene_type:complete